MLIKSEAVKDDDALVVELLEPVVPDAEPNELIVLVLIVLLSARAETRA
jgi:hypothetical protein